MSILSTVETDFAAQIATAVWLGNLTDTAAREALYSYAAAYHPGRRATSTRLRAALVSEYLHRRELQDACS